MRQQQMTRLIHSLPQLTHHQRQQLASSLQALLDHSQAIAVVEAHGSAHRTCPHCCSPQLVKNGSANGLQRFKCRQCARTFNALTGTPLARLHLRDKWMGQAQVLSEGLSLNQVALRLVWRKAPPFAGATASWPAPRACRHASLWASPRPMSPTSWSPAKAKEGCCAVLADGEVKRWLAARARNTPRC